MCVCVCVFISFRRYFLTNEMGILIIKKRCTNFSDFFFGMELYVFRTGFLSIIRSVVLYTKQ